jgi:hypothetical protein
VIRLARATALLLVVPFLTFASALAPQHVHEAGLGHDHAVAHSHFSPHDVALHESETTEIEHDIEHVVWLDSGILHQSTYRLAPIVTVGALRGDAVPPGVRWSVTAVDDSAPPHGPPKPVHLLRGPPLLLV